MSITYHPIGHVRSGIRDPVKPEEIRPALGRIDCIQVIGKIGARSAVAELAALDSITAHVTSVAAKPSRLLKRSGVVFNKRKEQ